MCKCGLRELGLKIDVDTYRGTKLGVPRILQTLEEFDIKASFFFSVGPDNMGRNLWRMIRIPFFLKMIRTRAPGLYGWDIILRGTMWRGPIIGERLPWVIKMASDQGHEVGLHAWDHYEWQTRLELMSESEVYESLKKGVELIKKIKGTPVSCSASPAWKCTDVSLIEKERLPLTYNSDCRGYSIFYPIIGTRTIQQPQIPTTLPTYDEVIGRNGVNDSNYNRYLMALIKPGRLNVLTIHAEVEGISRNIMFRDFLEDFLSRGGRIIPLRSLLVREIPRRSSRVVRQAVPGREGWVCCQS